MTKVEELKYWMPNYYKPSKNIVCEFMNEDECTVTMKDCDAIGHLCATAVRAIVKEAEELEMDLDSYLVMKINETNNT